jgi:hypothetical protein
MPTFTDELVKKLLIEFYNAGINLRLDRDEVLKTDLKLFDGFIKDADRAFNCGIKSAKGEKIENGELVHFQISTSNDLKQVYLGHVVLRRRYKAIVPEDLPTTRIIFTGTERKEGRRLCDLIEKDEMKSSK